VKLTPSEQNSLTKLSLSKIVANMKTQLEEEKKKCHNLCIKLEQAINDKQKLKLQLDNIKKKTTDDAISSDPKLYQALQAQSVETKAVEQ
jgi:transposase